MALVIVPPYAVTDLWPHVVPYLQRALDEVDEFRFDAEDILGQLVRKEAVLWVRDKPFDLVVFTEVLRHPKAVELSIGPIAGELGGQWEEELVQLEEWAREIGCSHVGTFGRPGWKRKLGWSHVASYCARRL